MAVVCLLGEDAFAVRAEIKAQAGAYLVRRAAHLEQKKQTAQAEQE